MTVPSQTDIRPEMLLGCLIEDSLPNTTREARRLIAPHNRDCGCDGPCVNSHPVKLERLYYMYGLEGLLLPLLMRCRTGVKDSEIRPDFPSCDSKSVNRQCTIGCQQGKRRARDTGPVGVEMKSQHPNLSDALTVAPPLLVRFGMRVVHCRA